MSQRELNILHLFPDLLNLYGDKGNIACLQKRLEDRSIKANISAHTDQSTSLNLDGIDIIFLGGGSDKEQEVVCGYLLKNKTQLKEYVENDGVLLATCGGFSMLGKTFPSSGKVIDGLGILDIYTEPSDKRLISNVVLKSDMFELPIVGFENHSGSTFIGEYTPLGKVIHGFGNTENSGYEGITYKNVVATYLHGPLLPKNPLLCDFLLLSALRKKYPDFTELSPLDDTLENQANQYIVSRFSNTQK